MAFSSRGRLWDRLEHLRLGQSLFMRDAAAFVSLLVDLPGGAFGLGLSGLGGAGTSPALELGDGAAGVAFRAGLS